MSSAGQIEQNALVSTIDEVEALLVQARQQQAEWAQRSDLLQKEHAGLVLSLARQANIPVGDAMQWLDARRQARAQAAQGQQVPQGAQEPGPADRAWLVMDRTTAVEEAMKEIGGPTNRHEIMQVLHRHGRADELGDISATLSYLARKDVAKRQDDGRWALLFVAAVAAFAIGATVSSGGGAG